MRKVAVISACRSPLGKIPGALNYISEVELLSRILLEAVHRSGIVPESIQEAYIGSSFPTERDNLSRKALLNAGLPPTISASTISKTCASSDEAFAYAVSKILSGNAETVLVGGVEKVSNSSYALHFMKKNIKSMVAKKIPQYNDIKHNLLENDMAYTCEMLSRKYGISRREQDEYTVESIAKAQQARRKGRFNHQIAPVTYLADENEYHLDMDELLLSDRPAQQIYEASPMFLSDGVLTQYNSSVMCDCAAAMVVMDRNKAASMGIKPLATVHATDSTGVEKEKIGFGMIESIKSVICKSGLHKDDIDLFEINESFAVQSILSMKLLDIHPEKVNVNGGNLALGYPVGCTGMRMYVTLIYEMVRRKARFGLSAICAGGNMGQSVIFANEEM